MGVATPEVKFDEASKTYSIEYQPVDSESGQPVGPKQVFKDTTLEGIATKLAAAHSNASSKAYAERRARKLGDLIELDPAKPIQEFRGRVPTADERTKLSKMLADPSQVVEGLALADEIRFGAPIAVVQDRLRYAEIRQRADEAQTEIDNFLSANEDYYPHPRNKNDLFKWLEKKNLSITQKNLESAFADLRDTLIQKPESPSAAPTPSANTVVPSAAATTEPPSSESNTPAATTPAAGNTSTPAACRGGRRCRWECRFAAR